MTFDSFSPEDAQRWILSPDSSYAVAFLPYVDEQGAPMFEPDSQVELFEFAKGRRRIIHTCGTPCDFEAAEWIDKQTVLIGGANWDQLRPQIYRFNIAKGVVHMFSGPQLPMERRQEIHKGIRKLWIEIFPWIRWEEP
jgi:hypothetical protein